MTRVHALITASIMILFLGAAAYAGQEACCLGDGFAAGRLLVTFSPGTEVEDVEQIALETETAVIRFLAEFSSGPIYIMQVPVERELDYATRFLNRPDVVRAAPDGIACAPILPPCSCCPIGIVCPTLTPCLSLHPVEIRLHRSPANGEVVISWGPSCSFGDETDYAVYEGTIGDYSSHTRITCADPVPSLEETIVPSSGSHYYLVVPHDGEVEGSLGTDGRSLERPRGAAVCLPARTFTPCPS